MRSHSLLWSFNYAIQGIVYALKTQRNMRLHAIAAAVVLVGALVLDVEPLGFVALIFAIGLVVVAELANTALEAVVDLAVETYDPMAKTAKDVAAGAVLVASIVAVAIGYVVLYAPLVRLATQGLDTVQRAPATLTLAALGLVSLAVLALKASTHAENFMRGGWPSGHTALATAAATAIGYATSSAQALVLGLFIAALVAQSRVESETHTIPQVIAGAAIGFLITTLVFQVLVGA